jgi:3-hydroxy-9,10-secoandrosta-1,3,5(10)-triene-9,17-dione monooxygenase
MAVGTGADAGAGISPPEPGLTSQEMIRRAVALRPLLSEQSAETERRTYPSDQIHRACQDAGFYRCYIPRRYGGYEFGAPTFMRVVQELSRGDVSTGWCIALAAAHALQIASWWPEPAQQEIFGNGDMRCAAVAAPIGPAVRSGAGWELTGKVGYCSGIPLSTHYMGQALIAGGDGKPSESMLLFVAPRSEFEILDDWGRLMGLKGQAPTRSRSTTAESQRTGRSRTRSWSISTSAVEVLPGWSCTATRCMAGERWPASRSPSQPRRSVAPTPRWTNTRR